MSIPGGDLFAGMGGNIYISTCAHVALEQALYMDVAEWKLNKIYTNMKCAHSGSFGAINRRRTSIDWNVSLKIFWDARNIPEIALQSGDSIALRLNIGSDLAWYQAGYTDLTRRYWYSPSGFLATVSNVDNSEGDDIYTQNLTIEGNSHIFLMPDETTFAATYMQWLYARGETNGVVIEVQ